MLVGDEDSDDDGGKAPGGGDTGLAADATHLLFIVPGGAVFVPRVDDGGDAAWQNAAITNALARQLAREPAPRAVAVAVLGGPAAGSRPRCLQVGGAAMPARATAVAVLAAFEAAAGEQLTVVQFRGTHDSQHLAPADAASAAASLAAVRVALRHL